MHRLALRLAPVVAPVVALVSSLAPAAAHADATVGVELSPDGMVLASQLAITPEQLAAQIKQEIDAAYQTNDVDGFLRDFTDATSFSARGLGADYGSTPRGFLAGIAGNVAAAGNSNVRTGDAPTAGLAANLAVLLGMNLREWNHRRWTVYVNGFYRNAATEDLDGNILSLGAHVQYRVMTPTDSDGPGTALRWLGLSVTSGIELTRWNLGSASESLATDFEVRGEGGTANLDYDAMGRFDLSSTAITIPIEATTGVRLALLLSVYGGVGVDLTLGQSAVAANLAGQLRTGDGRDIGTVTIDADGSRSGSPVAIRLLAGIQVNLWKVKVFVQANASATPAASVGLGVRFVQ
ncbi:MAG: hypothetical protein H0X17_05605 [Deltaproteobacteria bacterium]|nr:hypothetical protein [Deltaproteobacteria bacterium]